MIGIGEVAILACKGDVAIVDWTSRVGMNSWTHASFNWRGRHNMQCRGARARMHVFFEPATYVVIQRNYQ